MSTYIKYYRSIPDHHLLGEDNTAYIVFTKLLARVDWKTGSIKTGRKKFGQKMNLKPTTAWAALKRLENDRMIVMSSDKYKTEITVVNWKKYQSQEKSDDRSDDQVSTKFRPSYDTNNKNKRIKEEKNTNTSNDALKNFFFELVGLLGYSSTTKYVDDRKRKLVSRLRTYTKDDLRKAAKAIRSDDFMQGDNDNGTKYGTIDYLLRNDAQIARWLEKDSSKATNIKDVDINDGSWKVLI